MSSQSANTPHFQTTSLVWHSAASVMMMIRLSILTTLQTRRETREREPGPWVPTPALLRR
jgi:hypothetical protein